MRIKNFEKFNEGLISEIDIISQESSSEEDFKKKVEEYFMKENTPEHLKLLAKDQNFMKEIGKMYMDKGE